MLSLTKQKIQNIHKYPCIAREAAELTKDPENNNKEDGYRLAFISHESHLMCSPTDHESQQHTSKLLTPELKLWPAAM